MITHCARTLLVNDEGQDLVEYALLAAFVGLAGLAAFAAIRDAVAQGYVNWDMTEQSLWEPPDPG